MVYKFAQLDAQGNVIAVVQFDTHDRKTFVNPQGVRFAPVPEGVEDVIILESYKYKNDKWVFFGTRPTRWHKLNNKDEWIFDSEAAWYAVRQERALRLSATDWTQLGDIDVDTRVKWQAYRRALRDITKQADPLNIEWPVPPDGSAAPGNTN